MEYLSVRLSPELMKPVAFRQIYRKIRELIINSEQTANLIIIILWELVVSTFFSSSHCDSLRNQSLEWALLERSFSFRFWRKCQSRWAVFFFRPWSVSLNLKPHCLHWSERSWYKVSMAPSILLQKWVSRNETGLKKCKRTVLDPYLTLTQKALI